MNKQVYENADIWGKEHKNAILCSSICVNTSVFLYLPQTLTHMHKHSKLGIHCNWCQVLSSTSFLIQVKFQLHHAVCRGHKRRLTSPGFPSRNSRILVQLMRESHSWFRATNQFRPNSVFFCHCKRLKDTVKCSHFLSCHLCVPSYFLTVWVVVQNKINFQLYRKIDAFCPATDKFTFYFYFTDKTNQSNQCGNEQ